MTDRRRIDVWLPEHEWRAVDEAAAAAGVETGAVARLAVIRAFHGVCRDVSDGRITLRRRSGAVPMSPPIAASSAMAKPEPVPVLDAVAPTGGVGKASRPMVPAADPQEPSLDQRAMFARLRP